MSATDRCLERNAAYATRFHAGDLDAPPVEGLAVVTCMDARIETGALLGLGEGDAHVIRNAGGVVTQDVIRSLAISQAALGTREIMLIQHTACGMLAASDEELADAIAVRAERPPFPLGTFPNLEASVRRSLERLRTSPHLAHRDAIRGFVYEVETGRLREVGRG